MCNAERGAVELHGTQKVAWNNLVVLLAFLHVICSKEDFLNIFMFGYSPKFFTDAILHEIKDTPQWRELPQSCAALNAKKATASVKHLIGNYNADEKMVLMSPLSRKLRGTAL